MCSGFERWIIAMKALKILHPADDVGNLLNFLAAKWLVAGKMIWGVQLIK